MNPHCDDPADPARTRPQGKTQPDTFYFFGIIDIGAFELQQLFVVTTLQDKDDGSTDPGATRGEVSLRDVIEQANASSTPQTITDGQHVPG
jgi:hypothetical protein